jgi:hypothetical protein
MKDKVRFVFGALISIALYLVCGFFFSQYNNANNLSWYLLLLLFFSFFIVFAGTIFWVGLTALAIYKAFFEHDEE